MKKNIRYVCYVLILLALGLLLACGGGGSGDGGSPVVVVPPEEVINGIVVPPAPDPVEDDASVAGVDTNGNIVRDSVERMLAEEFGSDPVFYEQAKAYAIAEQAAIMDPTEEKVAASNDLLRCVESDQVLDDFEKVTMATIDTDERSYAYAEAFAGAYITSKGC